jgi:hypothetical protein
MITGTFGPVERACIRGAIGDYLRDRYHEAPDDLHNHQRIALLAAINRRPDAENFLRRIAARSPSQMVIDFLRNFN